MNGPSLPSNPGTQASQQHRGLRGLRGFRGLGRWLDQREQWLRWIAARFPGLPMRLCVTEPQIAVSPTQPDAAPRALVHVIEPDSPPLFTVTFHSAAALLRTVLDADRWFAADYSEGSIDIDGDLTHLLTSVYPYMPPARAVTPWRLPRSRNTLARSARNIHHHYDIGNDFYRLWLDTNMLYTCAYYEHPQATLEQAQVAKIEHIARKLELRPGQRVIEAGCGWGGLALHLAERFGVHVQAYNISHEQINHARAWAQQRGLSDRVEFIEQDYREIRPEPACDAFVSVGMLEHVGPENYRELGQVIRRCLKPEGRALIHTIGRHRPMPLSAWISRDIFPGAEPPSLQQMMEIFEPADLIVQDVENLRLHYARTLQHWLERFEVATPRIRDMFDERFVRTWRMYLAGSYAAFATGTLQLFQVLVTGPRCHDLTLTRSNWYAHLPPETPTGAARWTNGM